MASRKKRPHSRFVGFPGPCSITLRRPSNLQATLAAIRKEACGLEKSAVNPGRTARECQCYSIRFMPSIEIKTGFSNRSGEAAAVADVWQQISQESPQLVVMFAPCRWDQR